MKSILSKVFDFVLKFLGVLFHSTFGKKTKSDFTESKISEDDDVPTPNSKSDVKEVNYDIKSD